MSIFASPNEIIIREPNDVGLQCFFEEEKVAVWNDVGDFCVQFSGYYQCDVCAKEFKDASSLYRHNKTHKE